MSIADIKSTLPDFAKDIRVNLGSVISEDGSPNLNTQQLWGTALACAAACRHKPLLEAVRKDASEHLDEAHSNAALAAAALMGMNNVYYRFLHLAGNDAYQQLPARLRMTVIGNPGIDKADFELYSLAVSAINGCGMCITSHEKILQQGGVSTSTIQDAVRVASVLHAAAQVLSTQ